MEVARRRPASGTASGRVQVFARVRPSGPQENTFGPACIELIDNTVRLRNEGDAIERVLQGQAAEAALGSIEAKDFVFDGAFPPDSTQREVFTDVALPVLNECLQGFNGTILAYGQTGSGKTHSLLHQGQRGEDAGILPRLVAKLFVSIAQDPTSVYHVHSAALQVYNEQIDDLLHPEHQAGHGHNLPVQNGGVVPGLTWEKCSCPEALLDAFSRARTNVVYAETKMNKASSRSHAVFQISISKRPRATNAATSGTTQKVTCTHSRLSIVDLAGSERVKRSGVEGAQFREATAINKSLLAFGNVVSALASKKAHVPLRDSKLTRILDGSIGGNCKTALLVCASPAMESAHESLSTFEFASRAMRVEVDAKVNESVVEVDSKALLADLSGDTADGAVPLGPEMEALRKASIEASQRAEAESRRHEEVAAEARSEAKQLREEAKQFAEAVVTLEKARGKQADEASRLHQDVRKAEETSEIARKRWAEEAEQLRQEVEQAKKALDVAREEWAEEVNCLQHKAQDAQEALEKLRTEQAEEVAAHAEKTCLESERAKESLERAREQWAAGSQESLERARKQWAEKEADQLCLVAKQAEESLDRARQQSEEEVKQLQHQALEAQEALEKVNAAQWAKKAAQAEEALKNASEEAASQAETLRLEMRQSEEALEKAKEESASVAESLRLEARHAEEALEKAKEQWAEEAMALCGQAEAAEHRVSAFEVEVARCTKELHARAVALDEARAELEVFKSDTEERERRLQQQHDVELQARASAHSDDIMKLREEQAFVIDAQREAFEVRLAAGREDFEVRLASFQARSEQELSELQSQLEEQIEERRKADMEWKARQEQAISKVREDAEIRQRLLAGSFKAARCINATKESELREAHDDLARRFAARESREEDLRCIREQRAGLAEQQSLLRQREDRAKAMDRELRNRDATDQIFGQRAEELRRRTPRASSGSPRPPVLGISPSAEHGAMPPLPGKKLNELAHPFPDRRRRVRTPCRAHSADHGVISVR